MLSFGSNWKFIAILAVVFVLFGVNLVINEQEFKRVSMLEKQLNQTNTILSVIVSWSYQTNNMLNAVLNKTNIAK